MPKPSQRSHVVETDANLRLLPRVFPTQGDCPICRAGFKPSVLVPIKDQSGNASMITLSQTAYDKLRKLQKEHEPFTTELCLMDSRDIEIDRLDREADRLIDLGRNEEAGEKTKERLRLEAERDRERTRTLDT
jgi:hypothetical protein